MKFLFDGIIFIPRQEDLRKTGNHKVSVDKMTVREWLHANHLRLVKVRFGPEEAIHTVDRKGEKLRSVSFSSMENLEVEESQVRREQIFIIAHG